jgi:predicted MPP superfamily phosphohydrolase
LSFVPGNEITSLAVSEKEFELPALSPELDGLSILHLSDLHFTGQIERAYFDFVIDRMNDMPADLVVVTGDIIDKEHCLDWIAPTLGRLRARHGKFFILGNHDKRLPDVAALRREISNCDFIDLGGQCKVITLDDRRVLLAGNERPWFGPAPRVPSRAELEENEYGSDRGVLRILLSHSPDQLPWAKSNDFDLMLAGHTHGGQICFPVLGPVVTPSRFGVRYAAGVFYEHPTLLHVSRGISGLDPIRINCLPEVTRVVLRCAPGRIDSAAAHREGAAELLAETF